MALLVEHHEDLEIDLLSQGHDLLDFWRGKITPRRMRILLHSLPKDSRVLAKIDPQSVFLASWTPTDYILADLIDRYSAAHFKSPKPYQRPVHTWQAKLNAEAAAAFLEAQAERNRLRDQAG